MPLSGFIGTCFWLLLLQTAPSSARQDFRENVFKNQISITNPVLRNPSVLCTTASGAKYCEMGKLRCLLQSDKQSGLYKTFLTCCNSNMLAYYSKSSRGATLCSNSQFQLCSSSDYDRACVNVPGQCAGRSPTLEIATYHSFDDCCSAIKATPMTLSDGCQTCGNACSNTPPRAIPEYTILYGGYSWDQCAASCKGVGGRLAVIKSQDEFNAIAQIYYPVPHVYAIYPRQLYVDFKCDGGTLAWSSVDCPNVPFVPAGFSCSTDGCGILAMDGSYDLTIWQVGSCTASLSCICEFYY